MRSAPMSRRRFLARAGGAAAATALAGTAFAGRPRRAPNLVLILVDDLGWADLPCYGNTFVDTPNIDRLRGQGMRFTDAYAACPVCSPTRASIISGQYPAHVNLTDFIPGHWRPYEKLIVPEFNLSLPQEQITIAEALRDAGYATAAIGKWHLGGKGSLPDSHGFDLSRPAVRSNGDKAVRAITDASLGFIEEHRADPFFLYMSHHTVHIALEARASLVRKYERRAERMEAPCHPTYAAMIEQLDESTGEMMDKLDELGLADDTVLIFYSDNGGLIRRYDGQGDEVTSLGPLRAEKGTLYEGGVRVPLIVRWPGRVEPGSTCSVPVTSPDFYPTMLAMAGVAPPAGQDLDGESLVPLLRQRGRPEREAIYWHYPHYHHSCPAGAVRSGRYKLIESYEDGSLELYDLKRDIGETINLADRMPKRAQALADDLAAWRESVGANECRPNPDYDPARAHEWRPRNQ